MSEPDIDSIDPEPTEPRRASKHPRADIVLLSVVMTAASLAAILLIPEAGEPVRSAPVWVLPALFVAFAVAEATVFRFQFRREAIAFSISEVPTALAIVFVAPVPALAVRLAGSLVVILAVRRPPTYKLVFNFALFAFELSGAYLIVRLVIASAGDTNAVLVIAAAAATMVTSFLASVLVSVAIARFEGGLIHRVTTELRLAWWMFVVNAALAGMVLALALASPWLVFLSVVPLGLLWYVIKSYGAIDQRLRDLDAVHGFTGRVGQSLDPDEIGRAAVVEAAQVLRTEGAGLVLFDHESGVMLQRTGEIGVELPNDVDDPAWSFFVGSEQTQLVTGEQLAALRPEQRTDAVDAVREIMVAPIRDLTGAIGLMVVAGRTGAGKRFTDDDVVRVHNLTEQLAASLRKGMLHQRIEREARLDGLTGLPNRTSFERSIVEGGGQLKPGFTQFVLMLDLDRFKEVNDTLGHQAGDDLLVEVGERLARLLHADDVLARLAGDEFAVVGQRRDRAEMIELAWSCVREVGRPVTLDGLEIVVTASCGLAVVEDDLEEGAPLRYADIAMFNAKTQHLGVEVYRDEIDRRTPARLSMLGDLRSAIEDDDLHLHLQPKLDLATGEIVGAEALVRWTHAVRGSVPPAQFVRVAEDTGLIKQLTDLMLRRSVASLRDIHDRGYHLGLSVNLSTHDLLDTKLASRVEDHLRSNAVDPSMLTLEITESSLLIDAPRARATINELHEVGVRLSIDDFGTGYSSLSYLRRLPVGELKIDQSFVANVLLDEQDEVIVRSTIDLGHNLGLVVVAEGVENNEVLGRLQSLGCDVAQGYCISRPLAPKHLMSWLATTSHPSRRTDPLDFSKWVDVGESSTADADVPVTD